MKDFAAEPALLVGIVTRNRAALVSRAIESALAQRQISARVAVIDDGSQDETSGLSARFPSVEWLTKTKPEGYMAARNYWMKDASAKYFVSLDDDAWFLAGDELETAVSFMEQNPRVGAIAFDILSPDRPQPQERAGPEKVSSFIGCGHLLRLSAVREVGGYDELPGSYGAEEKDLCLRLMDASYDVVRLGGVHVWHEKTLVARELTEQIKSGVCNDLVMAVRRTPLLLLPPAMVMKFYRHIRFGVRKGLLHPVLGGIWMFLRYVPKSLASRHAVRTSTLRAFMQLRPE
jgi:GT2 family glycosyltransferase